MKLCTDIEQSKKLIELGIDVNTADMYYMYRHWEIDEETVGSQSDASIGFDSDFYYGTDNGKTYHYIPCWSISALLEIIRNNGRYELQMYEGGYYFEANGFMTESYFNAVDACVELILKLKEQELL